MNVYIIKIDNWIKPCGIKELSKNMKHITKLETLNLKSNEMGIEGTIELVRNIHYIRYLKVLNLSCIK